MVVHPDESAKKLRLIAHTVVTDRRMAGTCFGKWIFMTSSLLSSVQNRLPIFIPATFQPELSSQTEPRSRVYRSPVC